MDALKIHARDALAPAGHDIDRRLRAFRATDSFAIEACRAAKAMSQGDGGTFGEEIRRLVARSGAALVAASCSTSGGESERRFLERARADLAEARYCLYLARRLGALDLKRYRALTVQHDAAIREVDALLRAESPVAPRPPP